MLASKEEARDGNVRREEGLGILGDSWYFISSRSGQRGKKGSFLFPVIILALESTVCKIGMKCQ